MYNEHLSKLCVRPVDFVQSMRWLKESGIEDELGMIPEQFYAVPEDDSGFSTEIDPTMRGVLEILAEARQDDGLRESIMQGARFTNLSNYQYVASRYTGDVVETIVEITSNPIPVPPVDELHEFYQKTLFGPNPDPDIPMSETELRNGMVGHMKHICRFSGILPRDDIPRVLEGQIHTALLDRTREIDETQPITQAPPTPANPAPQPRKLVRCTVMRNPSRGSHIAEQGCVKITEKDIIDQVINISDTWENPLLTMSIHAHVISGTTPYHVVLTHVMEDVPSTINNIIESTKSMLASYQLMSPASRRTADK